MTINRLYIAFGALALVLGSGRVAAQNLDTMAYAVSPAGATLWSLDDCISYARENNIDVQQKVLQIEQQKIQLSSARDSRLPSVSASLGGDANFGRAISIDNNTYSNGNSLSGNLSASASLPVFQGFEITRQIRGAKLDLAAAMQDVELARQNLDINVVNLYLQVLFEKEIVGAAQNQLALSTMQTERSRAQVEAGKEPESTLYESQALQANDQLSLTQAQNDLQMALLNLSQALNRQSAAGFDVVVPVLDSTVIASLQKPASLDAIYGYAADNRPNLKAEQFRLQSAQNAIKTAKSGYYPTISLSGGYGTGVMDNDGIADGAFWRQFRKNGSEFVGLSVNIPIFNRSMTRHNVRSAQIAAKTQQLTLNNAELSLRKEIEQAWYDADAAFSQYNAAQAAFSSANIAFNYEEEKMNAGRSTIVDFTDAKTKMLKAQSDMIQAKYQYLFRSKILDFYYGRPITL